MKYLEKDEKFPVKDVIAIDLECENQLHHYGCFISLIQASTETEDYVIDVLSEKNPKTILEILEDEKIQKVFHDVDFDFRILDEQFSCKPKNIFDTKLAAELLGKEKIGLSSLLKDYFNLKKQSRFQMADWTKRPISKEMLEYAVNDTAHLLKLKNIFEKELKEKQLWQEALKRFKEIENKDFKLKKQNYTDIKGFRYLEKKEKEQLENLFKFRDFWARKLDRPPHFIMSNKKMIEFVKNPPEWKNVKGVHPIVRKRSFELEKIFNRF